MSATVAGVIGPQTSVWSRARHLPGSVSFLPSTSFFFLPAMQPFCPRLVEARRLLAPAYVPQHLISSSIVAIVIVPSCIECNAVLPHKIHTAVGRAAATEIKIGFSQQVLPRCVIMGVGKFPLCAPSTGRP